MSSHTWIAPVINTSLKWFRLAGLSCVVVMQMDQGKFHSAQHLDWPENIIPIFQPAHSPELNPIERLWEHLKAQLRWENCQSLKQLRLRLTDLLEQLTPELIASLTGWEFITTAVLSLSSH